ncbi:hypothetical protein ABQE69_08995 [Mycolicibacillus trivialis]
MTEIDPLPDWVTQTPSLPSLHTMPGEVMGGIQLPTLPQLGDFVQMLIDAILGWVAKALGSIEILGWKPFEEIAEWADKVSEFFNRIQQFLGGIDILSGSFDPVAAVQHFVDTMIEPLLDIPVLGDIIKALTGVVNGDLPDLEAWAKKLLDVFSPLNAANLFGWIPQIDLGSIGQTAPNLLTEGDFADPVTIDVNTGFYHDDAHGRTADGCAAFDGDSSGAVLVSELVRVSEGQKLDAGAWVSTEGAAGSADSVLVELQTYLGDVLVSSVTLGSLSPSGTSPGWVELSDEFVVPAGVDFVAVQLHVTSGLSGGTVRFDDVFVKKVQRLPIPFVDDLSNILSQAADTVQAIIDRIINAFENLGELVDTVLPVGGVLDAIFGIFDVGLGARAKTSELQARIRALESAANSITLDFGGSASSSLPGSWSTAMSGGGAGSIGLDGKGNLAWRPSGFGNRTQISVYTGGALTVDNCELQWILSSSPQSYVFDDAFTYVLFRAKDTSNYMRVRSGYDEIRLQAVVGGSVTTIGSPWSGRPKAGDAFVLSVGESGDSAKRHFVLARNGTPIIDATDSGEVSLLGADYRRVGVGMETGNRLVLFQNIPAGLGVLTASEVL